MDSTSHVYGFVTADVGSGVRGIYLLAGPDVGRTARGFDFEAAV